MNIREKVRKSGKIILVKDRLEKEDDGENIERKTEIWC